MPFASQTPVIQFVTKFLRRREGKGRLSAASLGAVPTRVNGGPKCKMPSPYAYGPPTGPPKGGLSGSARAGCCFNWCRLGGLSCSGSARNPGAIAFAMGRARSTWENSTRLKVSYCTIDPFDKCARAAGRPYADSRPVFAESTLRVPARGECPLLRVLREDACRQTQCCSIL